MPYEIDKLKNVIVYKKKFKKLLDSKFVMKDYILVTVLPESIAASRYE